MRLSFLIILLFCRVPVPAQTPNAPQAPSFQPVLPHTRQPGTIPQYGGLLMPDQYGQVHMGVTAEDIIRQANRNNPYYGYSDDPAGIQQANEAWVRKQMMKDPAYNPALRNGLNTRYPLSKDQELVQTIQGFINADNNRYIANGMKAESLTSADFMKKTKAYNDALRILKDMLGGRRKLSIAEAYFTVEDAYGEAYLTHQEFKSILSQSADFITEWMQEHHLDSRENSVINYAVQKFMGEDLMIAKTTQGEDGRPIYQTIGHEQFSYDFGDFSGDKDHRNFFLTKCLATGAGQCNSMPAVYLSLVEALGGKAYLAVAPQHSLVKYPDKDGNLRNYEPTSHWDITNEWYQDDMFISAKAAKTGVYLAPLNERQIVADIALQLAFGYFRKFGGADGKFIKGCIETAKPYFPKNNNLTIYFEYSNLYGYQLMQAMRRYNITRLEDIGSNAEAQRAFKQWQQNERIIEALGYQDEPRDMYEEMMKYHEFRGKAQDARHFNGKQKHSLFTIIK